MVIYAVTIIVVFNFNLVSIISHLIQLNQEKEELQESSANSEAAVRRQVSVHPANTRHSPNAVSMLGQRRRR